jgi:hypothetical protein
VDPAAALVGAACADAAARASLSVEELEALAPGRKRRGVVDDLTVVVICLKELGGGGIAGKRGRVSIEMTERGGQGEGGGCCAVEESQ